MNKKILVVIILIILVVAFFIIFKGNKNKDEKHRESNENVVNNMFSEIVIPEEKPNEVVVEESSDELKKVIVYEENDELESIANIISNKLNIDKYKIGKKKKDLSSYDIIFIGYELEEENIKEETEDFLKENNLEGKIIIPFSISEDFNDIFLKDKIKTIDIDENELKITYEEENIEDAVVEWLENLNFLENNNEE